MSASVSAAEAGLVSCESCHLLSRPAARSAPGYCPRCGAELVLLPVLHTNTLTGSEADTIMSGVIFLYTSGSWPLALVVLVASVMIPLGKLIALAYLLITVQRGSVKSNRDRIRLYRMVEIIGRWSMLDVFVDTFTVALVQLQPLMSVEPGVGVVFFMGVVILTVIAVQCFDRRLIWDAGRRWEARHA
jgi:paraquat-inducible protein A